MLVGKKSVYLMEYLIPPVMLILLLRFAFPALVTWFFERVVEPRAESASQQTRLTTEDVKEKSNAQRIAATREDLDRLKQRSDGKNGS